MRVTTFLKLDLLSGEILAHEFYEYSGQIADCKKGRDNLQQAANAAGTNVGTSQGLVKQGQDIANSEINTSGGLSPLVAKQLANEQGQIGKAYGSAAQAAQRGLSMRGMGAAPSGVGASLTNTANRNIGEAQTAATGNAFGTQNMLNNSALNIPESALNSSNQSIGAETNAGQAVNQAGSTLGDIGQGLSGLAGIGGSLFGLGGMAGQGGMFGKSIGK